MFLILCVGGEASPTQNALPHSLQPTQGFRSITSLCSERILYFINHLHLFSEKTVTSQPLICDSNRHLPYTGQHVLYRTSLQHINMGAFLSRRYYHCWIRAHPPPSPNLMKGSKLLFVIQREKLQTDVCVCPHRGTAVPSHTQMNSHESLCVALSVS